jgi:hypothetical protein
MNRGFVLIVWLALGLMISGCASVPPLDIEHANFGAAPKDAEAQIRQLHHDTYKDPDSIQYRFGKLEKGWHREPVIAGGAVVYGWIQSVEFNAKNGFGAYTGYEQHYFFFLNGTLLHDVTDQMRFGWAGTVGD